jgi:hypothetical protein
MIRSFPPFAIDRQIRDIRGCAILKIDELDAVRATAVAEGDVFKDVVLEQEGAVLEDPIVLDGDRVGADQVAGVVGGDSVAAVLAVEVERAAEVASRSVPVVVRLSLPMPPLNVMFEPTRVPTTSSESWPCKPLTTIVKSVVIVSLPLITTCVSLPLMPMMIVSLPAVAVERRGQ